MSTTDGESKGQDIAARLREAGRRARAEAEARRIARTPGLSRPREIEGTTGPEPTRYGDWEHKGLASDF